MQLAWVNSTPFGRPVVPDEYITKQTLSFRFTDAHWNFDGDDLNELYKKSLNAVTFEWLDVDPNTMTDRIKFDLIATLAKLSIVAGEPNTHFGRESFVVCVSSPETNVSYLFKFLQI